MTPQSRIRSQRSSHRSVRYPFLVPFQFSSTKKTKAGAQSSPESYQLRVWEATKQNSRDCTLFLNSSAPTRVLFMSANLWARTEAHLCEVLNLWLNCFCFFCRSSIRNGMMSGPMLWMRRLQLRLLLMCVMVFFVGDMRTLSQTLFSSLGPVRRISVARVSLGLWKLSTLSSGL